MRRRHHSGAHTTNPARSEVLDGLEAQERERNAWRNDVLEAHARAAYGESLGPP